MKTTELVAEPVQQSFDCQAASMSGTGCQLSMKAQVGPLQTLLLCFTAGRMALMNTVGFPGVPSEQAFLSAACVCGSMDTMDSSLEPCNKEFQGTRVML